MAYRVDEETGEIITDDIYICPYCNEELNDENWNYCEKCYSYVGVPSTHYRVYDSQSSNEKYNTNVNNQDNNSSIDWDKACCGTICLIFFLLWFTSLFL